MEKLPAPLRWLITALVCYIVLFHIVLPAVRYVLGPQRATTSRYSPRQTMPADPE